MRDSPDLAKRFRQSIREKVWSVLKPLGFDGFGDLNAWRHAGEFIDCVQFQTFPPLFGERQSFGFDSGGQELDVTAATFALVVGVYYSGVHSLPWKGETPARPRPAKGERNHPDTCHRELTLASTHSARGMNRQIFWIDPRGSNLDSVLADALKVLKERGLPWLDGTHNVDAYIEWGLHGDSPEQHSAKGHIQFGAPDEDLAAWMQWQQSLNLKAGETRDFGVTPPPPDLLERMMAKFAALEDQAGPRAHSALDRPPSGDALLGLLVQRGRWEEALQIQRQAADASSLESRLAEYEKSMRGPQAMAGLNPSIYAPWTDTEIKREISQARKMALKPLRREQEKLERLQELFMKQFDA